ILDTVSFGVQLANLSMARKPNGTGQFLQGTPTPNSNNDGTSIIEIDGNGETLYFGIKQNYPNPFNPITNIEFTIPSSGLVKLTVFDVLGREIKNLINTYKEKGSYSVKFDASNLSSGIYFYQLSLNKLVQTKSMIVTK
ncbi:MAG: T9SS type A sorting domain-containing protein, partial [Ignavibacteriaceae bacterium]|nr:T9SS type A sorting domain-containing protein [Ignavibacteriaceae bacterium]